MCGVGAVAEAWAQRRYTAPLVPSLPEAWMARFFAQLLSPVFLVLGVGGVFLGDASTPGKGELGPLDLDLTWPRDAFDLGLLALLVLVGFALSRHAGRLLMGGLGAVLVSAGLAGIVTGEAGFLGLRGSHPSNVFDLVAGVLALLAAAGTIEEPEPAQGSFLRGR